MAGIYFRTNKQMTESILSTDPLGFIKNLSDQIQNFGYVQNFELEVKMSPYRNRFLRLLDRAANYFRPKAINLRDLDEVRKHHSKGYQLKFNSRETILSNINIPVGTIVFKFSINDNTYVIEVYNNRVEIHDLIPIGKETQEKITDDLCESLLCGSFRNLYTE